jgi:hypothetical protein
VGLPARNLSGHKQRTRKLERNLLNLNIDGDISLTEDAVKFPLCQNITAVPPHRTGTFTSGAHPYHVPLSQLY